MTTTTLSLAILLRQLRQAQGLTQNELAEQASISMRTVSDIERGLSRYPHRDTLLLLAHALHLTQADTDQLLALARGTAHLEAEGLAAITHLPLPTTSFIGREAQLMAAEQTLRSTAHLLTLLGPAGIGKTRLAIAVGQHMTAHFPDGIYFVDLAHITDAERLLTAVARVLEVHEERAIDVAQTLDTRLRGRAMLLILDNCEQIVDAGTLIGRLIATHARLRIIVTTRVPLKIVGEHNMILDGLAYPAPARPFVPEEAGRYAAVALFTARAQATKPDFTLTRSIAPYIGRICAALQGIPLAIELAAAQIRTVGIPDIARQLTQRQPTSMLSWIVPRNENIPKRHETLEDAITWSYRLLDATAQVLLRRLSIFTGSFDSEAVIAVCAMQGHTETETIDVMMRLIDHQLAQSIMATSATSAPRFIMLDAIRAYGLNLLQQRQELAPLQQRHAAYYATLFGTLEADFVGEHQAAALARYTDEYANVIAAMQWAKAQGHVLLGLQLVAPLWWYWEKRHTLSEGREWLETMLALYDGRSSVPPRLLSRALYGLAILTLTQGDLPSAQRYAEACLSRCEESHEPELIAQAQSLLGTVAKMAGDNAAAIRYLQQSILMLRQLGLARQLAPVLNNLGTILIEQGDLAEATLILEEALALKEGLGDQRGVAVTFINLGEILKQQGAYQRALEAAHAAWEAFARLDDQLGMAMALNNQGEMLLAQHLPTPALERLRQSLTLFEQSDNRPGCAMVWRTLGDAYKEAGDHEQAISAWQASLGMSATGPHAEYCRQCIQGFEQS